MTRYDTIVVGLGAAGCATLYQLAKLGQRVLGIDRFTPPHAHGSSHGETRITRCAIGEGEDYVPLALRTHEIWRELEAETGTDLLVQSGLLMLADREQRAGYHGKVDFVQRTIRAAERFNIAHEILDAAEIEARFPQMRVSGNEMGYYEPGAGFVYPERCVAAQLALARRLGAHILCDTRIVAIDQDGPDAASVHTASGELFSAQTVIVAAGAWTPGLMGGTYQANLIITRQVLHWFAVADQAAYAPGRFPAFIWMHGPDPSDAIYGFPIPPGGSGIKIATEQFAEITADPDLLRREVTDAETAATFTRHIAPRILGVSSKAVRSATCIYTFTPDGDFLIDRADDNANVLVVSACSGHGFKHSAALGEAIALQVAEGAPAPCLAPFTAARLADTAPAE